MKTLPLAPIAIFAVVLGLFVAGWRMGESSSSPRAEAPTSLSNSHEATNTKSDIRGGSSEAVAEPVPSLVRQLVDPSLHLDEQIRAVRNLPSDLSELELASLIELIRQPQPENTSLSVWSTVVNEIMNVLREPRFRWPDYGQEMAGIMIDRHVDTVTRDYAAQHLGKWLSHPRDFYPENAFDTGLDGFVQLLGGDREAQQSVMGTALLSLCDLRRNRGEEPFGNHVEALEGVIYDLAVRKRPCSLPNQLAAIQAAGRMQVESALPAIRELAHSKEANPSVRLNSVAALGYYGSNEDIAFLEELSKSKDRLRFAAQTALENQAQKSHSF